MNLDIWIPRPTSTRSASTYYSVASNRSIGSSSSARPTGRCFSFDWLSQSCLSVSSSMVVEGCAPYRSLGLPSQTGKRGSVENKKRNVLAWYSGSTWNQWMNGSLRLQARWIRKPSKWVSQFSKSIGPIVFIVPWFPKTKGGSSVAYFLHGDWKTDVGEIRAITFFSTLQPASTRARWESDLPSFSPVVLSSSKI